MKAENLKRKVDEMTKKLEELERQVIEVNRMRASVRKSKTMAAKAALDQGSKKTKSGKDETSKTKNSRAKRMADIMRMCGNILRQIMQHKWGWPFLKPVDAVALNLHDYHEVITHPMDLGSVRERLEPRDDAIGYKHPEEIKADVQLTFRNALRYNAPGTDVYVMADTLLGKWEEKWEAAIAPKLAEEEVKRVLEEEEEDKDREIMAGHAMEEAAAEKLSQAVMKQLDELGGLLQVLNETAADRCRPMSVEEKRQLGHDIGRLSSDNLNRVIHIVAEKQPKINPAAEEVELDIDTQDPATLWRLHRYVSSVLYPDYSSGQFLKGHSNKKSKLAST